MGDHLLSRLRAYLGAWGIALVILAPLLAGAATAAATPLFTKSNVQATARVQLYPAIGTHAAYDVSSYVADFVSACTGSTAQEKAAQASGAPDSGGLLTAIREGDNAGALVTYTAPTAEGAEAGLRAAAQEALREVVQNDLDRQKLVVGVATESMASTLADFDALAKDPTVAHLSATDVAAARAAAVAQAGQRMQQARSDQITTEAALRGVPRLVDGTAVTTSTLSSTANQLRVIAAAAASAFVVALLIVLAVRRRRTTPPPTDSGDNS